MITVKYTLIAYKRDSKDCTSNDDYSSAHEVHINLDRVGLINELVRLKLVELRYNEIGYTFTILTYNNHISAREFTLIEREVDIIVKNKKVENETRRIEELVKKIQLRQEALEQEERIQYLLLKNKYERE